MVRETPQAVSTKRLMMEARRLLLLGDTEAGLAAFRRAAESAPGDVFVWSAYVAALREAGQKSRARNAVRRARFPKSVMRRLLDIAEGRRAPIDDIAALIRRGALTEAWQAGRQRLDSYPKDHQLLNLLGMAALADHDPVRAETVLRRALVLSPTSEAALANLGLCLLRQGRAGEAVDLLEPEAWQPGASLSLRVNLASSYLSSDRALEALRLAEDLSGENPEDQDILGIRASALVALGRAGEAVELLRPNAAATEFALQDVLADAIFEAEGREAALAYVGDLSELPVDAESRLSADIAEWGQLDLAAEFARRGAERAPENPAPYRLFGLCQTWVGGDPLFYRMRDMAEADELSPGKRGAFALALAKAHMDLGDDEAAFSALQAGNGLLRSQIEYDVEHDLAEMASVAVFWDRDRVRPSERGAEPAPIFVVGLPRSGSTLLETVLSRHRDVLALGESSLVYKAASDLRMRAEPGQLEALAERLAPGLTPAPPKRMVTDKLLANFMNLGVLASTFPGARFVEMRRDYRDIGMSIFQADLGAVSHPYSMDLEELGHYMVGFDRLMAHWSSVMRDRLVRVDYEAFVSRPDEQVPKLLSALGLDGDPACVDQAPPARRISTMSVAQARKPISKNSVGRWRKYATGLEPLLRILEENGLVSGS